MHLRRIYYSPLYISLYLLALNTFKWLQTSVNPQVLFQSSATRRNLSIQLQKHISYKISCLPKRKKTTHFVTNWAYFFFLQRFVSMPMENVTYQMIFRVEILASNNSCISSFIYSQQGSQEASFAFIAKRFAYRHRPYRISVR